MNKKRCAIYTRKSSEEGLEQDFNSLHAQREACEAFIISQKHEGWQMIKTAYDDGGISGGTMERPALRQLLADIENHRVDVIVVYKVDRLTRSLADFARMVELFDKHSVSFVSVTQQFNTTSSMGRLTLNVLLSFAQFEREVTGERIRDKIAASKKKVMWMGGNVPLGYEVKERKLLIKSDDAKTVKHIFQSYLELGCVRLLHNHIADRNICSVNGNIISRGVLYKMLSNSIYIGQVRHKELCYDGQHQGIIEQSLWDAVQQKLSDNRIGTKIHSRKTEPSLLNGKLFDVGGERLITVHANKKGRRYRYYISQSLAANPKDKAESGWRLPAVEIEKTVISVVLSIINDQNTIATSLREAGVTAQDLPMTLKTIRNIDAASVEKIIERVELNPDNLHLKLSISANNKSVIINHNIPMQIQRRGVEMRMIIANHQSAAVDFILIKNISLAHAWFNELLSGQVKNLAEIAMREKIDKGTLSRMINLAFLSPEIVERIIAGNQPPALTTEKLLKNIDLPLDWQQQKQLLGFA
jgi:site-specific DNA recombinase